MYSRVKRVRRQVIHYGSEPIGPKEKDDEEQEEEEEEEEDSSEETGQ